MCLGSVNSVERKWRSIVFLVDVEECDMPGIPIQMPLGGYLVFLLELFPKSFCDVNYGLISVDTNLHHKSQGDLP